MSALLAMLAAIALHEAGHALGAYLCGAQIHSLKLWPFPAVRIFNPHHRAKNALIALAAPALNLSLFVFFGCELWGVWAAAQLIVAVLALLPYPHSDSWRACVSR